MRTLTLLVGWLAFAASGCSKPATAVTPPPAPAQVPVAATPAPRPLPTAGHLPRLESLDRAHTARLFPKSRPSLMRCTISSAPTCELGKRPIINLVLVNKTAGDICLIKSLEGSGNGRRWPRCEMAIQRPVRRESDGGIFCAFIAPLKCEDFEMVPAGGEFHPFGQSGGEILLGKFDVPGVYRIQFHYSTLNKNLADYAGSEFPFHLKGPEDLAEIHRLFALVPHTQVSSNEIEVTVLPPKAE